MLAGHVVWWGCPLGLQAGPGVSRGCGSGRLSGSLPLNWTKRLAIFLLFSPPTHACGGLCCFCRLCRLYCCCRRRHCRLCRCRLLPEALARRSVEPEGPVLCVASSWCSTQGFVAGARSNGSASDPSEKRLHAIEGRSSGGCAAASSDLWLLVLGAARATLRCVAARERCHRGRSLPAAASASGTPSSTACRRTMGSHSGEAARVRRR